MLKLEMYMTIITLWKQGKSKNAIAKITECDRKTVRKMIKQYEEQGIDKPTRQVRSSVVATYNEQIVRLP